MNQPNKSPRTRVRDHASYMKYQSYVPSAQNNVGLLQCLVFFFYRASVCLFFPL